MRPDDHTDIARPAGLNRHMAWTFWNHRMVSVKRVLSLLVLVAGTLQRIYAQNPGNSLSYDVTEVPNLGTAGAGDFGLAMNDSGSVTGYFFNADFVSHGFLWDGKIVYDLGAAVLPYAINNRAQIVGGISNGSDYDAFLADNGDTEDLGTHSFAYGINNSGSTVGYDNNFPARAVIWEHGVAQPLELPPLASAIPYSINDAGDIVGEWNYGAVMWHQGHFQDLGTFGGQSAYAQAVNNRGQVIVAARTNNLSHAILWRDGTSQELLPFVGDVSAVPFAINDAGDVVGDSDQRPVIWPRDTPTAPIDLSGLIPPGSILDDPAAINNRGQILLRASYPNGHFPPPGRTFILTPHGR